MTTENKKLTIYEKNEKAIKRFALVAMIALVAGLIIIIAGVTMEMENDLLKGLAGYSFAIFLSLVPLLNVVTMANFHSYGVRGMGWKELLFFFCFIFPIGNFMFLICFFAGTHFCFSVADITPTQVFQNTAILYATLTIVGFILRKPKQVATMIFV